MGKKDFNLEELKAFIEEFHPRTLVEYMRYTRRLDLPKLGDMVVTLRSGFGGGPGMTRYVGGYCLKSTRKVEKDYESIDDVAYIQLVDTLLCTPRSTSCLDPNRWWRDVHIVEEIECTKENKCIRRYKRICCHTCPLFLVRECELRCDKKMNEC